MRNFIPCTDCGKKAQWSYMPGKENYCDIHVPRGCSCNRELKDGIDIESKEAEDPANYYEPVDSQGRKYPCCEFHEITDECHNDKKLVDFGWEVYFEEH